MNWVSKALYLEEKIKKLEKTLDLLTSHMQVDEDGNIVIEANSFDLHTESDMTLLSHANMTIKTTGNNGELNIEGDDCAVNITVEGENAELNINNNTTNDLDINTEGNLFISCYADINVLGTKSNSIITIQRGEDSITLDNTKLGITTSEKPIDISTKSGRGLSSGNINITSAGSKINIDATESDGDTGFVEISSQLVRVSGYGTGGNVEIIPDGRLTSTKPLEVVTS